MSLNRRTLIRGTAGILIAAGAGELLLPERRVWALGMWKQSEAALLDGGPDHFGDRWWKQFYARYHNAPWFIEVQVPEPRIVLDIPYPRPPVQMVVG